MIQSLSLSSSSQDLAIFYWAHITHTPSPQFVVHLLSICHLSDSTTFTTLISCLACQGQWPPPWGQCSDLCLLFCVWSYHKLVAPDTLLNWLGQFIGIGFGQVYTCLNSTCNIVLWHHTCTQANVLQLLCNHTLLGECTVWSQATLPI